MQNFVSQLLHYHQNPMIARVCRDKHLVVFEKVICSHASELIGLL
jgi:hypothetical protein